MLDSRQRESVFHTIGFLEGVSEALASYPPRIESGELPAEVLARVADDCRREADNLRRAFEPHGALDE